MPLKRSMGRSPKEPFRQGPGCMRPQSITRSQTKEKTALSIEATAHMASKSSVSRTTSRLPWVYSNAKKTAGSAERYFARFTLCRILVTASGLFRLAIMHWLARIKNGNAHMRNGKEDREHSSSASPSLGPGCPASMPRPPRRKTLDVEFNATHVDMAMSKKTFAREVRPSATNTSAKGTSLPGAGQKQRHKALANGARQRRCLLICEGNHPRSPKVVTP
mmetsp:Transcript_17416/g.38094  ORF Transcript_17416/g.38094 Transcript_17416/m.38094 type:complete len:220 (-) Transcript_17416:62-721(-)